MGTPQPTSAKPKTVLDQISTHWPVLGDPLQFTMCYASAIQAYLEALLKNRHDAEEVLQDFLLHGLMRGFVRAEQIRGRFRDYLKAAVRHAAIDHLRRQRLPRQGGINLTEIPSGEDPIETAWVDEWRRCLLARAWEALYRRQRRTSGNFCHTALRLASEHCEETSEALAGRAAAELGRPVSAAAFRQQVSRARRFFAELLLDEVAKTLEQPNPDQIADEMTEIGLMVYVRDFLPADWRERARQSDSE